MGVLYVRDVPESVSEVLKARAADEGMSMSSYVLAQLRILADKPTNAQIVERLRRKNRADGPGTQQILDTVQGSRR
ncbi:MAG: antitoxin [Actinomycetaceae bacterium]|nr:antitoxin [Actinomycetaceae bacterium]